jgi:hypothetical protein
MTNVNVEIYLTELFSFFEKNTSELVKLVKLEQKSLFFDGIRKASYFNFGLGEDFVLTKQQILDICVMVNKGKDPNNNVRYFDGPFGKINLN